MPSYLIQYRNRRLKLGRTAWGVQHCGTEVERLRRAPVTRRINHGSLGQRKCTADKCMMIISDCYVLDNCFLTGIVGSPVSGDGALRLLLAAASVAIEASRPARDDEAG